MAGLAEAVAWADEIYQIEQSDPVIAGPPNLAQGKGVTNVPHAQLANRTAFLKAAIERIDATLNNITNGAPEALNTLAEITAALAESDDAAAAMTAALAQKIGRDEFATNAQALAGLVADKVVSPAALAAALAPKMNAADFTPASVASKLGETDVSLPHLVATLAPGDATTAGRWAKIASLDLSAAETNSEVSAVMQLRGEAQHWAGAVDFHVQARQDGGNPTMNASLDILAATRSDLFAHDCLRLVMADAAPTAELWLRVDRAWGQVRLLASSEVQRRGGTITYHNGATWTDVEPPNVAGSVLNSRGVTSFGVPSGVPIGAELTFTGLVPPTGFLIEDGGHYQRADYPELWEHAQTSGMLDPTGANGFYFGPGDGATSFSVPDARGYHLRVLDGGRGVDLGRALGSPQDDAIKSHYHDISFSSAEHEGNTGSGHVSSVGGGSQGTFTGATGGAETRPKNIARTLIIRAY